MPCLIIFVLFQLRLSKVSELIHNSTNHRDLDTAKVSVYFQEIIDLVRALQILYPTSQLLFLHVFVLACTCTLLLCRKKSQSIHFLLHSSCILRRISYFLGKDGYNVNLEHDCPGLNMAAAAQIQCLSVHMTLFCRLASHMGGAELYVFCRMTRPLRLCPARILWCRGRRTATTPATTTLTGARAASGRLLTCSRAKALIWTTIASSSCRYSPLQTSLGTLHGHAI